ncbi:hypothetical protein [Cognataquiflexum aquatile]|uniref:hypothetical protein n=1 Tax=Cognataquiflexum aquatile TaxID=2249427 RepID=UPI000DEA5193|nr:hypothetical protein [Cognataquiflexum aquatile]
MPSLKKSQRILRSQKLIGNFLSKPLQIGDIVQNDEGQHLIIGNIVNLIPGFSLQGKIVTSPKFQFKVASESNISVEIGGTATAPIAQGEIQLKFNSKNSAFVVLKNAVRSSVALGLVENELKSYWKSKGYDQPGNRNKFHFINDIIESESGTMIFSEEKSNTVVIKGKNNTPLTSVSVVGEGKVEYVTNTKATLEIISESPIMPLYGAVRIKANGKFDIVG